MAIPEPIETPRPRRSAMRRLVTDPQAIITSAFILLLVVLGALAPLITQQGPNVASLQAINADVGTPGLPLGGDQSGRDIFSRLIHSINTSVITALIGATTATVLGLTFGLIGGYFGGRVRAGIEVLFNLIMTFPGLLLLIVLMPLTGGDFRITMLIFGVLLSPGVYRIVRNVTVGVRNELYVDAARASGLETWRILLRHVMPAIRGPVIVATAFIMGGAIGTQSGLAFLGVGSTEVPSFGAMIASGFLNLYVDWTQFLWPALTLGLMTSSFVLLGNALRDALEGPRPKAVRATGGMRVATAAVRVAGAAPHAASGGALLEVRDLEIAYPSPEGGPSKQVLHGVSLELRAGETLGLVGESGSGKSQTAFAIMKLLPTTATVTGGSVRLDGQELLPLKEQEMRAIRGRDIAYVPQEPMANLDPAYTVGAQLIEGIRATTPLHRRAARERALELLEKVGIPDPPRTFASYPHQISGGMAQRVLIAAAIASRPRVLIADEPTTALDVTIQAEILDLLRDLQQEMGMAILLVTHNFGVVADICDRIAVMKEGRIVEHGDVIEVFQEPKHPYTRTLLGSILDDTTVRDDARSGHHATTKESQ